MLLQSRVGVLRRIVAPEPVNQAVGGDDRAGLEEQQREEGALLSTAETKLPIALPDLERAEDAEFEPSRQTATVPRSSAPGQAPDSDL